MSRIIGIKREIPIEVKPETEEQETGENDEEQDSGK